MTDVDAIRAAVAGGWCVPPNTAKEMDVELGEAIVQALIPLVADARAEAAWNVAKALRTWVSERQSDVLGCADLSFNEENAALIWLSNFGRAIDAAAEATP